MAKHKKGDLLVPEEEKKRRGPKQRVIPNWVRGRADNLRVFLHNAWDRVWPQLSLAQKAEDVTLAFRVIPSAENEPILRDPGLILQVIKEKTFPKRRQARINFLADSLAGLGVVSPRRSRDICAAERAALKNKGQILRWEYYIECSCNYKGHSMGHACPDCGAQIMPSPLFSSLVE